MVAVPPRDRLGARSPGHGLRPGAAAVQDRQGPPPDACGVQRTPRCHPLRDRNTGRCRPRGRAHLGGGEEDALLSLSPALPDDKEPNKYWFHHRASRLNKLRDALIRNDAPWLQPYHARFWAAEDLERMSPHWKPPKPKEEESDAKTDVDG